MSYYIEVSDCCYSTLGVYSTLLAGMLGCNAIVDESEICRPNRRIWSLVKENRIVCPIIVAGMKAGLALTNLHQIVLTSVRLAEPCSMDSVCGL